MHAHCCLAARERSKGAGRQAAYPPTGDNGKEFYAEWTGATRLVFAAGRG